MGILAWLVALLPWSALAAPGRALGWLAGTWLRIRRSHVESAMAAAGIEDPSHRADDMYAALGRSAVEFLWMSRRAAEFARHVTIDPASAARWRAALEGGRGVVIAASHTGNWDLAACAMAADVELLVVTKHLSMASIDRFWQSTRARQGVALTGPIGAMARSRDVLRRGGAVAMMIDQVPSSRRHAVAVDFLGQPAFADRAPAALAAAARAPLVVAAARRDACGGHVLHVLEVIEPPRPLAGPPRAGPWIAGATATATQALEAFVKAYPGQWLWMHRRWKPPAEGRRTGTGAPPPGVDPGAREATLAPPWAKIRSSSPGEPSRAG